MARVISLWQPWAQLLVTGHKIIETRGWDTQVRGQLFIHAAKKTFSQKQWAEIVDGVRQPYFDEALGATQLVYGAIIGCVNLVETFQFGGKRSQEYFSQIGTRASHKEFAFGDFAHGRWGWRVESPVLLEKPIAVRGGQGFFSYPDDELRAAGLEHLLVAPPLNVQPSLFQT